MINVVWEAIDWTTGSWCWRTWTGKTSFTLWRILRRRKRAFWSTGSSDITAGRNLQYIDGRKFAHFIYLEFLRNYTYNQTCRLKLTMLLPTRAPAKTIGSSPGRGTLSSKMHMAARWGSLKSLKGSSQNGMKFKFPKKVSAAWGN